MMTQTFEIKVALLGYVSAGKTTVLNALLQDKFSEVSMRRTTAGVNFFRVFTKSHTKCTSAVSEDEDNEDDVEMVHGDGASNSDSNSTSEMKGGDTTTWLLEPDSIQTANETMQVITEANAKLRQTNEIAETTFDVEIVKPLCDMHKDTKLVLLDIPGLNEAGSKDIYREYVNAKWDSFDCVIVVMDVFQGVNTEEQVQLLQLVKKNLAEKKNMPIIVLCNKVDDPDNEEIMMLVDEVRTKVEQIFQGDPIENDEHRDVDAEPVIAAPAFIPISAENAFVYRTASHLSFEQFKTLDKALVDKLGRDEVPMSKWRKLTRDQKYGAAFDAVKNEATYEASLAASNFHEFLDVFNQCVGGEAIQRKLIVGQLAVTLRELTFENVIANELKKICDIHKFLGLLDAPFKDYFWDTYKKFAPQCVDTFKSDVDHGILQVAMSQLVEYGVFLGQQVGIEEDEHRKVLEKMISLVRLQINVVVDNAALWTRRTSLNEKNLVDWSQNGGAWIHAGDEYSYDIRDPPFDNPHHWDRHDAGCWKNKYTDVVVEGEYNPASGKLIWSLLSLQDFTTLAESILLLSSSKHFCEYFGREKVLLESLVRKCHHAIDQILAMPESLDCRRGTLNDEGVFVPTYPNTFELYEQIDMPDRLSDPCHWGHLAWKFCEFMDVNRKQPVSGK